MLFKLHSRTCHSSICLALFLTSRPLHNTLSLSYYLHPELFVQCIHRKNIECLMRWNKRSVVNVYESITPSVLVALAREIHNHVRGDCVP